MIGKLAWRFLTIPSKRLLWKFLFTFGWNGLQSIRRFKKQQRRGEEGQPAFLMISVTDRCNFSCRGCWVSSGGSGRELSVEELDYIILSGKKHGSRFFGILGGEPLMHRGILDLFDRHRDCYFQLFTNGTLLDKAVAARLARAGNVTPLVSIEGLGEAGDRRRGGQNVTNSALTALEHCRKAGLITGVATSICKTNIDDLVNESFLDALTESSALYVWYYIYRPVGPDPAPELALNHEEILRLRRFLVDVRRRTPMMVVDAYWDHLGRALCPGAVGISHHIGPGGDLEFCPPVQFAAEKAQHGRDVMETLRDSAFLRSFREYARCEGRGCVLLENPAGLHRFLKQSGAADTTGRSRGLDELENMRPVAGHDLGDDAIPEKHWLYRFAKKNWFFGFGAYG